jgi:hypothetical protein
MSVIRFPLALSRCQLGGVFIYPRRKVNSDHTAKAALVPIRQVGEILQQW